MDELQIEYSREWMETYLKIQAESTSYSYVDEQILKNNDLCGFLRFEVQSTAEGSVYKYTVTGKKTLNTAYSVLGLRLKDVCQLLNGLIQVYERAREYLLRENGFLIDGEYIFLDKDMKEVSFLYLPGQDISFSRQLTTLLQKMINMVDYTDREAVDALYKCYSAVAKDSEGISELKSILEEYSICKTDEASKNSVWKQEDHEGVRSQETTDVFETFTAHTGILEEKRDFFDHFQLPQWIKKLIDKNEDDMSANSSTINEMRRGDKIEALGEMKDAIIKDVLKESKKESKINDNSKEKKTLDYVESYDDEEFQTQTVYLSKQCMETGARLINTKNNAITIIDTDSFVIGSLKGSVNFSIEDEGISRLHAVITQKAKEYFIEDLNSLNGTTQNGNEVLPGKKSLLLNNDRLVFAQSEFIFKV